MNELNVMMTWDLVQKNLEKLIETRSKGSS